MSLPPNFCFIWNNRVAGSAHPGAAGSLAANLAGLHEQGIGAILSLSEEPLDTAALREFGMEYLHLPVDDFSAPTPAQVDEAIRFMDGQIAQNHGVLVHCRAGYGRTGTLLACFLVSRGMDPESAIREVRRLRPGSLEVYSQEDCVYQFARRIRRQTPPDAR